MKIKTVRKQNVSTVTALNRWGEEQSYLRLTAQSWWQFRGQALELVDVDEMLAIELAYQSEVPS